MEVGRSELVAAFHAAVSAVDPEAGTRRAITVAPDAIEVDSIVFDDIGEVVVVGLGKAAPAMARGVADAIGHVRGVVVSDHREDAPVEVLVGGHPIPTSSSLDGGRAILDVVTTVSEDDLVLFLVSGGGSAVAEVPVAGIGLDDLAVTNSVLIESGLPIEDINEIRSSISQIKGGRLLRACRSRRAVTLVLSDVVGASERHVASGPTLGQGLGTRASAIVQRSGIADRLPVPVIAAMARPAVGPELHPCVTIGSPAVAAEAAATELRRSGLDVEILTTTMTGPVAAAVDEVLEAVRPGRAIVAAGETTVTVTGDGLGGRNQHAALIAARRISGRTVRFGAFGTDGRDGPTDAAGAVVDGRSVERMEMAEIDIEAAIRTFDAHPALRSSGDLVVTGPTGTNVADVWIAVDDAV